MKNPLDPLDLCERGLLLDLCERGELMSTPEREDVCPHICSRKRALSYCATESPCKRRQMTGKGSSLDQLEPCKRGQVGVSTAEKAEDEEEVCQLMV